MPSGYWLLQGQGTPHNENNILTKQSFTWLNTRQVEVCIWVLLGEEQYPLFMTVTLSSLKTFLIGHTELRPQEDRPLQPSVIPL